MAEIGLGRLKNKIEEVLTLWETRSLAEIPSAKRSGSLVLRKTVPLYLEHLSHALASNRKMDITSVIAHNAESVRIGRHHGADRAGMSGYLLTEVISEYHILREVIFQVLEEDGQMKTAHRDIILDSIEQAVNDTAVRFSEVQSDVQQRFIDTLSHDLKNPIMAAKINAQLIAKGQRPEKDPILATRIIGSMNRLNTMIHDLLDAGRVRAGEPLSLQYLDCDLNNVVRDVIEEMTAVHGDRFVVRSAEPVDGSWGRDGVRRAVENLVGNAVKYGADAAPITVSLVKRDEVVELSVHNEGPSIAPDDVPLLFEQYRRTKSAEEGPQAGWGLGLAVVKGVVDAHLGKVHVVSAEGEGTRFTLELPYAQVANL